MTSNLDISFPKVFLPLITLILALFSWPKSIQLFLGHSYWDPFLSGQRSFFLFCLLISFLLLLRLKHFSTSMKVLSLIAIACLFIEWHLLYINLPAMHTPLCRVPPPSTYFPWYQAIFFALIGSVCFGFLLIHPKSRLEILEIPPINHGSLDTDLLMNHFFYQITSIPMLLGLFHGTFLIYSVTGSIGCNGIPLSLLGLIAFPWILAACCSSIHHFSQIKLVFTPYLFFFGFLMSLTVLMNISPFFDNNFLFGVANESIDIIILIFELFFSSLPVLIYLNMKVSSS